MHVRTTLTLEDMDAIAAGLGIVTYQAKYLRSSYCGKYAGLNHLSLMLRPERGSDEYRSYGYNGRRVHAINWSGHAAFMTELFERDPNATVDSALARYHGRDEFDRLHRSTGSDINRGFREKVTA